MTSTTYTDKLTPWYRYVLTFPLSPALRGAFLMLLQVLYSDK